MICHRKPFAFSKLQAGRLRTLSLRGLRVWVNLARSRVLLLSGTPVHLTARIHRISVDASTGKRYSVRILGKYLVIIAHPVKPPPEGGCSASRSEVPPITSVDTDLKGGHFSA